MSADKYPSIFSARWRLLFIYRDPGGTPLYGLYRYIGMGSPRGYGFSAVLVMNGLSILAILVINRISVL